MARLRNASVPSSAGRKRPHESDGQAESTEARHEISNDSGYSSHKSHNSPGKNVSFHRRLEQGPTVIDPATRLPSPVRSALHQRSERSGQYSLSVQLRDEERAANQASGAKEATGRTTSSGAKAAQSKRAKTTSGTQAWPLQKNEELFDKMSSYMSPPYPLTDEELCGTMDVLRMRIVTFASDLAKVDEKGDDVLTDLLSPDNRHLARLIGCLAQGGRDNVDGWVKLLAKADCRVALITGIVGRVLKENVFSELYFGATEKLKGDLHKQEQGLVHQDGFDRTKQRLGFLMKYKMAGDQGSFHVAVAKLIIQLEDLTLPLSSLGAEADEWSFEDNRRLLQKIVMVAGNLSRSMRMHQDGDVVYYWSTTFKDEEFDPGRMECLNLKSMIEHSPYIKTTENGYERAIMNPSFKDERRDETEAIVRIVCFPGLTAYRRHGGELAKQILADEEAATRSEAFHQPPDVRGRNKHLAAEEKELTGKEGFRTKTICKSIVHLQWGKQRLLTKEAGTSAHIDAMQGRNGKTMDRYTSDSKGYVELWDLYQEVNKNGKAVENLVDEYKRKVDVTSGCRWFSLSGKS